MTHYAFATFSQASLVHLVYASYFDGRPFIYFGTIKQIFKKNSGTGAPDFNFHFILQHKVIAEKMCLTYFLKTYLSLCPVQSFSWILPKTPQRRS